MIVRERLAPYLGPSSAAALLLCAAGLAFGASRDFGMFLLSLFALPLLAIIALGALLLDVAKRRRQVASLGAILLIVSPVGYLASAASHDWVRFAGWALAHPGMIVRPGPSRVVTTWDSWGMAGSGNDSYLAIDQEHGLGSAAGNERWNRIVAQTCDIVSVQRMWPAFYIVTTYNCPFDGYPF